MHRVYFLCAVVIFVLGIDCVALAQTGTQERVGRFQLYQTESLLFLLDTVDGRLWRCGYQPATEEQIKMLLELVRDGAMDSTDVSLQTLIANSPHPQPIQQAIQWVHDHPKYLGVPALLNVLTQYLSTHDTPMRGCKFHDAVRKLPNNSQPRETRNLQYFLSVEKESADEQIKAIFQKTKNPSVPSPSTWLPAVRKNNIKERATPGTLDEQP